MFLSGFFDGFLWMFGLSMSFDGFSWNVAWCSMGFPRAFMKFMSLHGDSHLASHGVSCVLMKSAESIMRFHMRKHANTFFEKH